jgi:hypothetical protein
MIFLKSILGGIGAVVLTWIIIVCVFAWRTNVAASQEGMTGLVAVAGGWSHLLRMPLVAVLLTAAFGVGLYLTAYWISN